MMVRARGRQRDLPTRQFLSMREAFPQFTPTPGNRGGVVWRGSLQPTSDSPNYQIVIVHPFNQVPDVRVARPALIADAPHRYRDGSLCLYWPEEWSWTPEAKLADTLVPWTALWLYYYEIWTVTGDWLGPSSPHGNEASGVLE